MGDAGSSVGRPALGDNVAGALFMVGSMAGFAVNDALIKLAGAEMGLFQAILIRGLGASLLILTLAAMLGAFRLAPGRRDWEMCIRDSFLAATPDAKEGA